MTLDQFVEKYGDIKMVLTSCNHGKIKFTAHPRHGLNVSATGDAEDIECGHTMSIKQLAKKYVRFSHNGNPLER